MTIGVSGASGEQHLIKMASRWTILRMNYYAESMAEEIQMSLGVNLLTGLAGRAPTSSDVLTAALATGGAR